MKLRFRTLLFSTLLVFSILFSGAVSAFAAREATTVELINPIGGSAQNKKGERNVTIIVGNAIKVALGIVGSITLLVFVYSGFQWLTSAGNSEKVRSGASAMLYATIGLFIIFGAYAILNTILKGIAK